MEPNLDAYLLEEPSLFPCHRCCYCYSILLHNIAAELIASIALGALTDFASSVLWTIRAAAAAASHAEPGPASACWIVWQRAY